MGGIIFPNGGCIFDSCDLCDMSPHVDVRKVDDMSQAAGVETGFI